MKKIILVGLLIVLAFISVPVAQYHDARREEQRIAFNISETNRKIWYKNECDKIERARKELRENHEASMKMYDQMWKESREFWAAISPANIGK